MRPVEGDEEDECCDSGTGAAVVGVADGVDGELPIACCVVASVIPGLAGEPAAGELPAPAPALPGPMSSRVSRRSGGDATATDSRIFL